MTMRILTHLTVALTLGTLLMGTPMFFAAAQEPDHKLNIPIKGGVPEEFLKAGQRTFDVHLAQLTVRLAQCHTSTDEVSKRRLTHHSRTSLTRTHTPRARRALLLLLLVFPRRRRRRRRRERWKKKKKLLFDVDENKQDVMFFYFFFGPIARMFFW